jgi:hypothetical protein
MATIEDLTLQEKDILIDELQWLRKCEKDQKINEEFLNRLPPITDESIKELNAAIRGEPILKETDEFWKPRKISFGDRISMLLTRILHR